MERFPQNPKTPNIWKIISQEEAAEIFNSRGGLKAALIEKIWLIFQKF